MKKEWNEKELKEIANQLGNPDGSMGLKTAERMNQSNANMIRLGVEALHIKAGDNVLEIGPGNGAHVPLIVQDSENITYHGIDISATMVLEACKLNESLMADGRVSFSLSDGDTLAFSDNRFDKIVTVNTVYFWQAPLAYAREIYRVLKPGGIFALVFSDESFMKELPFTKFGFELYSRASAEKLLKDADFVIQKTIEVLEVTKSNLDEEVERPVIIVLAEK